MFLVFLVQVVRKSCFPAGRGSVVNDEVMILLEKLSEITHPSSHSESTLIGKCFCKEM